MRQNVGGKHNRVSSVKLCTKFQWLIPTDITIMCHKSCYVCFKPQISKVKAFLKPACSIWNKNYFNGGQCHSKAIVNSWCDWVWMFSFRFSFVCFLIKKHLFAWPHIHKASYKQMGGHEVGGRQFGANQNKKLLLVIVIGNIFGNTLTRFQCVTKCTSHQITDVTSSLMYLPCAWSAK